MKYKLLILSLVYVFAGYSQNYQDSVMLLNGKTFRGNIVKQTEEFLILNSVFKEGKPEEQISLENYRVFSYTQFGVENVVYKYDSLSENFLTIDQSRKFALGSYDANNFYDTKAVYYSSLGITLGFSLWDTYRSKASVEASGNPELRSGFFGRSPSIWPIASVLVLPISFGLPSTKVRTKNMVNGVRGDNFYYSGFNNAARQKRSFSALKGSLSGLVLGFGSYYIANAIIK